VITLSDCVAAPRGGARERDQVRLPDVLGRDDRGRSPTRCRVRRWQQAEPRCAHSRAGRGRGRRGGVRCGRASVDRRQPNLLRELPSGVRAGARRRLGLRRWLGYASRYIVTAAPRARRHVSLRQPAACSCPAGSTACVGRRCASGAPVERPWGRAGLRRRSGRRTPRRLVLATLTAAPCAAAPDRRGSAGSDRRARADHSGWPRPVARADRWCAPSRRAVQVVQVRMRRSSPSDDREAVACDHQEAPGRSRGGTCTAARRLQDVDADAERRRRGVWRFEDAQVRSRDRPPSDLVELRMNQPSSAGQPPESGGPSILGFVHGGYLEVVSAGRRLGCGHGLKLGIDPRCPCLMSTGRRPSTPRSGFNADTTPRQRRDPVRPADARPLGMLDLDREGLVKTPPGSARVSSSSSTTRGRARRARRARGGPSATCTLPVGSVRLLSDPDGNGCRSRRSRRAARRVALGDSLRPVRAGRSSGRLPGAGVVPLWGQVFLCRIWRCGNERLTPFGHTLVRPARTALRATTHPLRPQSRSRAEARYARACPSSTAPCARAWPPGSCEGLGGVDVAERGCQGTTSSRRRAEALGQHGARVP